MLVRTSESVCHDVHAASDGATAPARAEARPDVIVLDVAMPGMDGPAVSRRLARKGQRVPILFLTAGDAFSDLVAGLDAGGDHYLVKPFVIDDREACLRAVSGAVVPVIGSRTVI